MRRLAALLSLAVLCCLAISQSALADPQAWSGRVVDVEDHQITVLRYGREMTMRFDREAEVRIVGERVRIFPFASDEELTIGQLCLIDDDRYGDPTYSPVGTVWYLDWIVPDRPEFAHVCYCHDLGCDGCHRHYYGRSLSGRCECLTCERHRGFQFSITINIGRSWPSIVWHPIPPRRPIAWDPGPPHHPDHRPPMPPRYDDRPPIGPRPPDFRPPMPPWHPGDGPPTPHRPDVRPPMPPRQPDTKPTVPPRRDWGRPPIPGGHHGSIAPRPPRDDRPPTSTGPPSGGHGKVSPAPHEGRRVRR